MQPQGELPKRRVPSFGDLMTLVATVALGLALYRYSDWLSQTRQGQVVIDAKLYLEIIDIVSIYVIPSLIAGTIGYAAVRLRRPRPPWKQLVTLPGTVAVNSVIVVLSWTYLWMAIHLIRGKAPAFVADPMTFANGFNPGWAVAGSWSTLLLTGCWHSDGSWVDRLGIGLGVAWLGLLPLWYAIPLLVR
jgi:hypothetical protein